MLSKGTSLPLNTRRTSRNPWIDIRKEASAGAYLDRKVYLKNLDREIRFPGDFNTKGDIVVIKRSRGWPALGEVPLPLSSSSLSPPPSSSMAAPSPSFQHAHFLPRSGSAVPFGTSAHPMSSSFSSIHIIVSKISLGYPSSSNLLVSRSLEWPALQLSYPTFQCAQALQTCLLLALWSDQLFS